MGLAALGWERWATRWTDLIICCSEAERRLGLEAKIQGMSLTVGNGIDLTQFPHPTSADRSEARKRLGIDSAASVAVCVGRLQPQKGQETAIAAWRLVREAAPGAILLVVGAGPDDAKLKALAGDGVTFVGPVASPRDYYLAADVCLLPSLWEGLSLALLEGMACERSTVATDVPGCSEVLLDGEPAGGVVRIGDAEQMAAAVVSRFLSPELAAAEGKAARTRIQARYTTQAVGTWLNVAYDLVWRMRKSTSVIDLVSAENPRTPQTRPGVVAERPGA